MTGHQEHEEVLISKGNLAHVDLMEYQGHQEQMVSKAYLDGIDHQRHREVLVR